MYYKNIVPLYGIITRKLTYDLNITLKNNCNGIT